MGRRIHVTQLAANKLSQGRQEPYLSVCGKEDTCNKTSLVRYYAPDFSTGPQVNRFSYVYTRIHTRKKKTLTYIHTFIYTHVCICIYTSVYIKYIFLYAYTHRLTNTYKIYSYYILHTHTHSQAYTHTSIHKYIHPLSLSLSLSHTHTHTHTPLAVLEKFLTRQKWTESKQVRKHVLALTYLLSFWVPFDTVGSLLFSLILCLFDAWFLPFYGTLFTWHAHDFWRFTTGVHGFTPDIPSKGHQGCVVSPRPKSPYVLFLQKTVRCTFMISVRDTVRCTFIINKRTGQRTLYVYN